MVMRVEGKNCRRGFDKEWLRMNPHMERYIFITVRGRSREAGGEDGNDGNDGNDARFAHDTLAGIYFRILERVKEHTC